MRKFLIGVAVAGLAAASIAPLAQSSASATTTHRAAATASLHAVSTAGVRPGAVVGHARYYSPHVQHKYNVTGPTVKFFNAFTNVGATRYNQKMIGTHPNDPAHPAATVHVVVIPLALHFTNNVTLSPLATLPSCAGGGTAANRFMQSGLVKNITFASSLGGSRQFLEGYRRAEFFQYSHSGGSNPNYSNRLSFTQTPLQTVN